MWYKCRKMLSISESIDDMEAYTQLNDQVYYRILYSTDPALEEVSNHGNQHPVCVANITVKCMTICKGKYIIILSCLNQLKTIDLLCIKLKIQLHCICFLFKARNILLRIEKRDLYKCIGQTLSRKLREEVMLWQ